MNSQFSIIIVRDKNLDISFCCYICICICIHTFPKLALMREPGSCKTSVPVTITSIQDVVSEYYSPLKETRAFWRND